MMPMLLSPATAMLLLLPVLTTTLPDEVVAAMPILLAPVAVALTVIWAPADVLSTPTTVTLPAAVVARVP